MTSLAISDVPWISKRIKACCRRAKLFGTDEILLASPKQLQQALRISEADTELLLLQVATASAPPPVSVLDALNGRLPNGLDDSLFGQDQNGDDSDIDSQASEADNSTNATVFPSSSVVPPTQGYDGNFPGAQQYVYDSDTDSDGDADSPSDIMMHDDIEQPCTFRPRLPQNERHHPDQDEASSDLESSHDNMPNTKALPTVARDVLSLGRERHLSSTGSEELDNLLGGGFRSAILTEIVGESGSGKTQLAIQTCTYAALGLLPLARPDEQDTSSLPSLDTEIFEEATLRDALQGYGMLPMFDSVTSNSGVGVCYITSGGERGAHSIVKRALELAAGAIRERFDRLASTQEAEGSQACFDRQILLARALELGREQVLRNLHVACVADVEALEHALKYSLPGLIDRLAKQRSRDINQISSSTRIGVIVIDNLPSLFQEDPATSDIDSLAQRSKMLAEIAEALKRLAAPRDVQSERDVVRSAGRVVLVLNHVSDAFSVDKEIARRFVFDSADRIRLRRSQAQRSAGHHEPLPSSALPDSPAAMDYASQSAFVSGLIASVPPTLAEAISTRVAREDGGGSNDGTLYVLNPRTAQLGHTWANLINVRLFLSKTQGRVSMPQDGSAAAASVVSSEASGKSTPVMTTVRKAAVVLNPFGPTMLDPPDAGPSTSTRGIGASGTSQQKGKGTAIRQLRFVITPTKAVYALDPYSLTNLSAVATLATTCPNHTPAPSNHLAETNPPLTDNDKEEDFFAQFDRLEDHHLLAIDRLEAQSLPTTPLS